MLYTYTAVSTEATTNRLSYFPTYSLIQFSRFLLGHRRREALPDPHPEGKHGMFIYINYIKETTTSRLSYFRLYFLIYSSCVCSGHRRREALPDPHPERDPFIFVYIRIQR